MAFYSNNCKICGGPSEEEICWECNPDPELDYWKLRKKGIPVKKENGISGGI